VKLLVLEHGTEALRAAAGGARAVVSSRIAYVEGRAFIGRAARERRLSAREASRVRALLSTLWTGLVIVELDSELGTTAGDVAERLQLRGMDAIHLASALRVAETSDEPTQFATWDVRLAAAAVGQGLETFPQAGDTPS